MKKNYEKIKYEVITTFTSAAMNLVCFTNKGELYNYKKETKPCIYAAWHGLMYAFGWIPERKNIYILISVSKDGEIIAYSSKKVGFKVIRGSLRRRGMQATREIIRVLDAGNNIAYAVDGPKGPNYEVKPGLIKIAQLSQKPIIPLSADVTYKKKFKSWDYFELPLPVPFTKVSLVFGDPIYVLEDSTDEQLEEYRLKVEKELFRLRIEAEKQLRENCHDSL